MSREDDARQLHAAGYTKRAVWAKWVLDDYVKLHAHLTDNGEPLEDHPRVDSSFYLSPAEWREAATAARGIADLAVLIASDLELERRAPEAGQGSQ